MIVSSQYVTMFMVNGAAMVPVQGADGQVDMKEAREALEDVYAHGWQPLETISVGIGRTEGDMPQIQLVLHLVKYEDETSPVKAAVSKSA